jgi:hypothetical protein
LIKILIHSAMAEHEPEGENQSEWHQAVEQAFEALNLTRSATKEGMCFLMLAASGSIL